ncbi:hypothetical protein CVT24_010902, partial [Panaeolus cyanescens]
SIQCPISNTRTTRSSTKPEPTVQPVLDKNPASQPSQGTKCRRQNASKDDGDPALGERANAAQEKPSKRPKLPSNQSKDNAQSNTPVQCHSSRPAKPTNRAMNATPMKRRRRTKAEIEADRQATEQAKLMKEEEAKKRVQQLAQLNQVDQANRYHKMTHLIRNHSDLPIPEDEFVGYRDDETSMDNPLQQVESDSPDLGFKPESCSSDDASSCDELAVGTDEVEDLEESYRRLQQQMDALKERMDGNHQRQAKGGKKLTKRHDVKVASGLRPDWKSQTDITRSKQASRTSSLAITEKGLDDVDAISVNPYRREESSTKHGKVWNPKPFKMGSRDLSRQNDLVIVNSDVVSDNLKRVRSSGTSSNGRTSHALNATTHTVKAEIDDSDDGSTYQKSSQSKKPAKCTINSNNVRVEDLPDFAQDRRWKKVFLPSLYDRFFTSSDPFENFLKGSSSFISIIQETLDEVYPTISYKVSSSDPIHAMAYNRINEKRSAIGSTALSTVEGYIETLSKNGSARKDWLIWASRPDGPLFFRHPVDADSPRDRRDPNYKNPSGRLRSKFIISILQAFGRLRKGSVVDGGYPTGLVALIMAALERAVRICLQGNDTDVKEFCRDLWGSKVVLYYESLKSINENDWKVVLADAGLRDSVSINSNDLDEIAANLSFTDQNRAALFDFASPMKHQ